MLSSSTWINRSVKAAAWTTLLLLLWSSIVVLGQVIGVSSAWSTTCALAAFLPIAYCLRLKTAGSIALALTVLASIAYLSQSPSNDRDWIPSVARLPEIQIEENSLLINNLRDFNWRSTTDFDERWIERGFDLKQLNGLDVHVVPFGDSELAAHVMLSFNFANGQHLVVSVETRPEHGESYSLIGGATRQLELIYLFGTERDLLGLRIFHRHDRVYSYPIREQSGFAKTLLLELSASANQLHDQPKFYATLRHNCTTTLLRHVNRIREKPVAFHKEILFPAKLAELLHRLNYLDTKIEWPTAKEAFRVDTIMLQTENAQNFSKTLRSKR